MPGIVHASPLTTFAAAAVTTVDGSGVNVGVVGVTEVTGGGGGGGGRGLEVGTGCAVTDTGGGGGGFEVGTGCAVTVTGGGGGGGGAVVGTKPPGRVGTA